MTEENKNRGVGAKAYFCWTISEETKEEMVLEVQKEIKSAFPECKVRRLSPNPYVHRSLPGLYITELAGKNDNNYDYFWPYEYDGEKKELASNVVEAIQLSIYRRDLQKDIDRRNSIVGAIKLPFRSSNLSRVTLLVLMLVIILLFYHIHGDIVIEIIKAFPF